MDDCSQEEEFSYLADQIANGLSQLGRSADGTMQVFLTLSLSVSEKEKNVFLISLWYVNIFCIILFRYM